MKTAAFFLGLLFTVSIISCGPNTDKPTEAAAPEGPEGMVLYDFSEQGLNVSMYVPDTTEMIPMLEFNGQGKLEARFGMNFQMEIGEGGDLDLKKTDLKENDVFKSEMLEEEASGIVYKSFVDIEDSGVPTQYHFYAVINVNGIDYEIQDIEGAEPFGKDAILKMYEAAKTLAASGKPAS